MSTDSYTLHMTQPELIGVARIAELVKRSRTWVYEAIKDRSTNGFPEPAGTYDGRDAYSRNAVKAWAAEHVKGWIDPDQETP